MLLDATYRTRNRILGMALCCVLGAGTAFALDRAEQPPVDPSVDEQQPNPQADDYRIGEEDEIEISVYGDDDLTKTQIVRIGGKISFPLIGDVKASGLTPDELRQVITQRLATHVLDPKVTVIVTKYVSRKVSILGEVKTPGALRMSSDVHLLDAISRMGGITEDADLQTAILLRNKQVVAVDFEKLLKKGDLSQDILLRPDDVIVIPTVKDKKIFVLGQVARPGVLPLRPGLTLLESISRVEGVTETADLRGAMLVRDGQVMQLDFVKLLKHGDTAQDTPLRHNDLVLIPDLKDRKISVLGEVQKPSTIFLSPGMTLVESISSAGGFTSAAQLRTVLLIRGGLGNPNLLVVNVHEIAREGALSKNVVLEPGDIVYVPRSLISNVTKFFQDIASIIAPVILARAGLSLPGR